MKIPGIRTAGLVGVLLMLVGGCRKSDSSRAASPAAQSGAGASTEKPAAIRAPDGTLALAYPSGKPVDGVKLSQYDWGIISPCIAVGPDGVIHVAYNEQLPTSPYTQFIYHRQSSDGGATWSEPKNLSEDMPNVGVGTCKLIIDGQNRTYVIWRTGAGPYGSGGQQEAQATVSNLVYRCLENGKWSQILRVHKPTSQNQDDGSMSFVATVDGAGKAHVIYNTSPNRFHPDQALAGNSMTLAGIGWGLIFQETLDGSNPVEPHEWYMSKIKVNPANPVYDRSCDGFNALDGYVDRAGNPHLIAQIVNYSDPSAHMQLIEDGKQTPSIVLPPDAYGEFAVHPPRMLVDAKGVRHIIAKYDAGEHHAIRDYVMGSDEEPTIIMAAKTAPATILDFNAYQGPSGKMGAIIQTTDNVTSGTGESWLCTKDGGKWSEPICLTNNAGRKTWVAKQTGVLGSLAAGDSYSPGPGAIAWDKEGNIVIALINKKNGSFGLAAGGVTYAAGSSVTPMFFFYRL